MYPKCIPRVFRDLWLGYDRIHSQYNSRPISNLLRGPRGSHQCIRRDRQALGFSAGRPQHCGGPRRAPRCHWQRPGAHCRRRCTRNKFGWQSHCLLSARAVGSRQGSNHVTKMHSLLEPQGWAGLLLGITPQSFTHSDDLLPPSARHEPAATSNAATAPQTTSALDRSLLGRETSRSST